MYMFRFKFFISLVAVLLSSVVSFAAKQNVETLVLQKQTQETPLTWGDINKIDYFENAEECRKYNDAALICSEYVLNNFCFDDPRCLISQKFILIWAQSSDEIYISIGNKITECFYSSTPLLSVYLAACTKFNRTDELEKGNKKFTKRMFVYSINEVVKYYIKYKKDINKLKKKKAGKVPEIMADYVKMYNGGTLNSYLEKLYDEDKTK